VGYGLPDGWRPHRTECPQQNRRRRLHHDRVRTDLRPAGGRTAVPTSDGEGDEGGPATVNGCGAALRSSGRYLMMTRIRMSDAVPADVVPNPIDLTGARVLTGGGGHAAAGQRDELLDVDVAGARRVRHAGHRRGEQILRAERAAHGRCADGGVDR